METVTTIIGLLNNPLVQIGGAALGLLALALLAYAIKTQPTVRDLAEDFADVTEELEPWVKEMEPKLVPGPVKYAFVFDKAQAWLKKQGIVGRRGRLIKKYLPGLIEITLERLKRLKRRQAQGDRQAS